MKQFVASISVVAALMLSAPLQAQDLENKLAACAAVKNPLERLVCFDDVAAGKSIGPAAQQSAAQNQATANAERGRANSKSDTVSEFGREHLGKQGDAAETSEDRIYVDIASHSENAFGLLRIVTSDGQVWQQQTAERFPFAADARYFIERGMLNSYYLGRTDLNARTRVKRIK